MSNVARSRPAQPSPALPVQPAQTSAFPDSNPFSGKSLFVNPAYAEKVEASAKRSPEHAEQLLRLAQQPTALWLDRIATLEHLPGWLNQAAATSSVPVFVIYDLPNRDCAAHASAGELLIEEDGERRYREEYIDVIAQQFAAFPNQDIVVIVEPDSLPNLISNLGIGSCALSHDVYLHSVAYAISRLSLPNVAVYLDAAHAGWLGWEANQRRMVKLIKRVLDLAGGPDRIRGFATNVSNYNALEGQWGKRLEASNPAPSELAYVDMFRATLKDEGIGDKAFIVDTSRNGQPGTRTRWGNWCNIQGAGLGERPRVAPREGVDAYYWVKPPGESDGTSDPDAQRFDPNCASEDAVVGAPEAGQWFHSYLLELVSNANPTL